MLRETTSGGLCGLVIRSEVENEMSMKFVACVYIYCNTFDKAVRVGGGERGGHVMRETTSRGRCGLVCPSRTSERGGEGDCVKEGGGEEGERERERALGLLLCHSPRY